MEPFISYHHDDDENHKDASKRMDIGPKLIPDIIKSHSKVVISKVLWLLIENQPDPHWRQTGGPKLFLQHTQPRQGRLFHPLELHWNWKQKPQAQEYQIGASGIDDERWMFFCTKKKLSFNKNSVHSRSCSLYFA